MLKRSFAILLLMLVVICCAAQTNPSSAGEIHQLYINDQTDRGVVFDGKRPADITPEQMSANDVVRRQRASQLLNQGVLQTGEDFHDAAFIFQHGDKAEDYLLAHVLAMLAVSKGNPDGRWIAAATLDRYLQTIGQPQVFGTQYAERGYMELLDQARKQAALNSKTQSDGKSAAQPAGQASQSSPSAVARNDQESKKQDEYLQEPYNYSLIPDSLRAQYCVPPIADQKARVSELNGGKPAPRKPLPGCSK
jgi:hypothetical protein